MPSDGYTNLEDLLIDLSASFVNVAPELLDDDCIISVLRNIVLFLGVDRSSIAQFDEECGRIQFTHSWAAEGVDPLPLSFDESNFPYLARRIRAGKNLILDRIEDLPPLAATDAASARHIGLKSVAIVPLSAGGNILGYLSIGSLKTERNWPENFVRRLMLIGEIFANALLSQQKETELRQTLAESMTIRQRVEAENAAWREEVLHGDDSVEVVGESPQTIALLRQVDQVAQTDSTVLLLGETGTGKDLIARVIHQRSRRAKRPLIRVNCATLPSTLIESELFGHEKGAFTGAVVHKPGRFELAHGGTIVLDEIGELPLELQAKLLQVLQTGEFERLGSAETRYTDARVIAATNRDLEKMSLDGTFRQDLYYRLGVFPLTLPPLREHKTDIPLLAAYFVERLRTKMGKQIMRIPDQAIAELLAYSWPGNVRELENIVERSMILSPESHLVVDNLMDAAAKSGKTSVQSETETASMRTLEEVEREYIRSICKRCGWKVAGNGSAAEILDLHPSTLRSRMKKLGISRPPIG